MTVEALSVITKLEVAGELIGRNRVPVTRSKLEKFLGDTPHVPNIRAIRLPPPQPFGSRPSLETSTFGLRSYKKRRERNDPPLDYGSIFPTVT